jgi:hypothetical protein
MENPCQNIVKILFEIEFEKIDIIEIEAQEKNQFDTLTQNPLNKYES